MKKRLRKFLSVAALVRSERASVRLQNKHRVLKRVLDVCFATFWPFKQEQEQTNSERERRAQLIIETKLLR